MKPDCKELTNKESFLTSCDTPKGPKNSIKPLSNTLYETE
jgi:hypothetical protein